MRPTIMKPARSAGWCRKKSGEAIAAEALCAFSTASLSSPPIDADETPPAPATPDRMSEALERNGRPVGAMAQVSSMNPPRPTPPARLTVRAQLAPASPSAGLAKHAREASGVLGKHARWQAELSALLESEGRTVDRVLLGPATVLGAIETALHIRRMQPSEVLKLSPGLRAICLRFQDRVRTVELDELLPRSGSGAPHRRPPPLPTRATRVGPSPLGRKGPFGQRSLLRGGPASLRLAQANEAWGLQQPWQQPGHEVCSEPSKEAEGAAKVEKPARPGAVPDANKAVDTTTLSAIDTTVAADTHAEMWSSFSARHWG